MTNSYEEVEPIDREEAEKVFRSHDIAATSETLVRVAFHEADWRWAQEWCLNLINNSEPSLQKIAITCLGHIARVHGTLDKSLVMPVLSNLLNDSTLGGIVQDVLDDIAVFVKD